MNAFETGGTGFGNTPKQEPEPELFYLQNVTAGYLGNSPLFWRKGGSGYTQWIDEAELFTREKAGNLARAATGTHAFVIWSRTEIEKVARRTVDMQDLRKDSI